MADDERTCARKRGCRNAETAPTCLVCPFALECPQCHRPAGSPCKRPSGHRAPRPHSKRVLLADALALRDHREIVLAALGPEETAEWDAKVEGIL